MRHPSEVLGKLLTDSLSEEHETLYSRYLGTFSKGEIDKLLSLPFDERSRLYQAWMSRPKSSSAANYAVRTARAPLPDGDPSPWTELATRVLEDGLSHE
jgi:hypothetical protein